MVAKRRMKSTNLLRPICDEARPLSRLSRSTAVRKAMISFSICVRSSSGESSRCRTMSYTAAKQATSERQARACQSQHAAPVACADSSVSFGPAVSSVYEGEGILSKRSRPPHWTNSRGYYKKTSVNGHQRFLISVMGAYRARETSQQLQQVSKHSLRGEGQ